MDMSYTEVLLVRDADASHLDRPEVVAGRAPYSMLTEEGVQQAVELGETWAKAGYSPDVAHSSPLIRGMNTLDIALRESGIVLPIVLRPALADQSLGGHEGQPHDAVYSPYTQQMIGNQGAMFRHQGVNREGIPGEALLDVSKRMATYLKGIQVGVLELPRSVVAMSHHVPIKSFLSYLELGGVDGTADRLTLPHELLRLTLGRQAIGPCETTMIVIEGGPDPMNISLTVKD
jgi:broad specificity phosphatase PhoE